MLKTKEEYEELINHSPLFAIDKEKDTALYQKEKYNLLCLITDYYRFYIYKGKKLEEYSVVLIDTAIECIKYYDKEKGRLVNLLNHNMKRNFVVARAKEYSNKTRQGITIGKKEEKQLRMIIKYAKSKNLDIQDLAVQEQIAKVLNIDLKRVAELIQLNLNLTVISSTSKNDDGDEVELYDLQMSHEKSAEDKMVEKDKLSELVDKIEDAYLSLQDRLTTKRLIAMLITAEIIKTFQDELEQIMDRMKERSFFNEEVMSNFIKTGTILTSKEIAERLKVLPASASRTYKNFIAKIQR